MLTTGASHAGIAVSAPAMALMLGFDEGEALMWPCILAMGMTVVATVAYFVVAGNALQEKQENGAG
jgi:hypothetical protein